MTNVILRMFLPEVLALLQMTIKNPSSLAAEAAILTTIRDTLNTILAGISTPGSTT